MEILEVQGDFGAIGVKVIADDGTVFRRVIQPGGLDGTTFVPTDLKGESDEIQALAAKTWTKDIVAAWEAMLLSEIPPPVRAMVVKSVVQARIIDVGKMGDAYAMLTANPVYFARWFAPDHPAVYCDDPDAVGLVLALGLDPAVILAP
jgi:hypothetical protein